MGEQKQNERLFAKVLAEGNSLVITRTHIDTEPLAFAEGIAAAGAVYIMQVALHAPERPGIVLAATPIRPSGGPEDASFRVIDVFVGKSDVVVAGLAGSNIALWRVPFDAPWTSTGGWALTPPDQRVAVRRVIDPANVAIDMQPRPDGRWTMTVKYGLNAANPTTVIFLQQPDAWRFVQVDPPWPR